MKTKELILEIKVGKYDSAFSKLYVNTDTEQIRTRYISAVNKYAEIYGDNDVCIFSVGGRTEIMGNHTDHNCGEVIAASISRDIIAVASASDDNIIKVKSKGHDEDVTDLSDLSPIPEKFFTSAELTRGICKGFLDRGYKFGGFRAYTESEVLGGSGLSSSAAFEVMIGNILNHFYNFGKVSNEEIAKISQYAENVYFGKPCGLMDQMACAVGGMVHIDFEDPSNPVIEKINPGSLSENYKFCIVYPGGSHADLNDDYASVPEEMKSVADSLGEKVLRRIKESEVVENIPMLREKNGDRAVLRAMHYFAENERVSYSAEALKSEDYSAFFKNITASGNSSFKYLQNVYSNTNVRSQGLSLALALSERFFERKDAYMRVHGGGFAGTILVIVNNKYADEYREFTEKCFGKGSCIMLDIRKYGAVNIFDLRS